MCVAEKTGAEAVSFMLRSLVSDSFSFTYAHIAAMAEA